MTDADGRLEGPFNLMLINPAVGNALQSLGSAIRFSTALTARQRELAILEVAAFTRSDFEWYAHERLGRRAGLTEDEIAAVHNGVEAAGLEAAGLDPGERAVRELSRQILATGDLDDPSFQQGAAVLGVELVTELVVLIGYYRLLALAMLVLRTPLPASAAPIEWPPRPAETS